MSRENNQTMRKYIREYADKHGISFEVAKEHAMCKLAELYFKENKKK